MTEPRLDLLRETAVQRELREERDTVNGPVPETPPSSPPEGPLTTGTNHLRDRTSLSTSPSGSPYGGASVPVVVPCEGEIITGTALAAWDADEAFR